MHAPTILASTIQVLGPVVAIVGLTALFVLRRMIVELRERVRALENLVSETQASPTIASPLPQPPPVESREAITPEILGVIVAAVHVTLGLEARVVGVSEATVRGHAWSVEGRRQIFHSHKVR